MQNIKDYLSKYKSAAVAFSGGVDSTVVLKLAKEVYKDKLIAFTFRSSLHPKCDIEATEEIAKTIGVKHIIIDIDEFSEENIVNNPVDRCYHCKKAAFTKMRQEADKYSLEAVLDGTNADDLNIYRPGLKALSELNIVSPLAACGITKEQVREIAKELDLSVHSKPSTPCLATRIPYNTAITRDLLIKIEKCEEYVKQKGFTDIRVRAHGDIARLEVNKEDFNKIIEQEDIVKFFRETGFLYVTLDLEGFMSGSMDKTHL